MGDLLSLQRARAPRIATRLLEFLLPASVREPLLGDLAETFEIVAGARGIHAARLWYWSEAVRALLMLARPQRSGHVTAPVQGDAMTTVLWGDLRFALRQLGRRPAFTAIVVGTLALGIGATTAIFSAVYPILFAPLPYPHAERIVTLTERGKDGQPAGIGFATIKDIRDMNRSFDAVAALKGWSPTMTGRAEPERLNGDQVSATYFRVLGVSPALGRDFRAEEDAQGAARVTILGNALWRSRFGGDSSLVGRSITLDGIAFTVIGVMPAGFESLMDPQAQLWSPLRYDVSLPWACRTCHHLVAVGRLKPGVTPGNALRELNVISARLVADHPTEYQGPGMLVPTLAAQVSSSVRPALLAVLGAVALLLLIACANVTNLLLARAAQRHGEFSVRRALGAGQHRILRQLITESLTLALAAGVIGIGIAVAGVRALVAIAPSALPRLAAIRVNGPVLLFTLTVASVVGLVFGLVPAVQAARGDLNPGLKQNTRRGGGTRRLTRGTLVVAEVALAMMLLIGSGLMLRTMSRLLAVSPGFEAQHLLTMQVQTTGPRFNDDAVTHDFFERVLQAVRATPGVSAAAFTSQLPLSGAFDTYGTHIESKPNPNPENDPSPFRYAVSDGYLETMQIPLLHGRLLQASDRAGQPEAVVINETFARKLWPGENPIGQRVRIGGNDGPWWTIVGVVGDVRQTSLAAEQPFAVYLPEVQWKFPDGALTLVIRTKGDPAALIPAARRAIWSVDRNQPIFAIATMTTLVAGTEAQRHFTLVLFTVFAVAALLLAAAGIYGVLSGTVNERLGEIGVRSALGASRNNILGLVLRQGMTLTGAGVVLGLIGAMLLSRAMATMLFGVSPVDATTYAGVAALLVGVSAVSCWLPAARAARVDPAITLRAE